MLLAPLQIRYKALAIDFDSRRGPVSQTASDHCKKGLTRSARDQTILRAHLARSVHNSKHKRNQDVEVDKEYAKAGH